MSKKENKKENKKICNVGDKFFITGKALYCFTNKPNKKGRMPSHNYEVGIKNPESDYNIDSFVKDTVIKDKEGNEQQVERIKIANSKYPIPMFDMNNDRLPEPKAVPNDTDITIYVEVKHSNEFNQDYLVCKAIKLNEEVKEFNPFV